MLRVTGYGFGEASGPQLKFVLGFRSYGLGFEFSRDAIRVSLGFRFSRDEIWVRVRVS